MQRLLRLSGAAFVNIKPSRTTGRIRSRANKQRCSERSAPLWFVLAIIVLSLRNAGVEGFASGLETHAVQERSKTLQPVCRTESGDNDEQTPREVKGEPGEAVPPTPLSRAQSRGLLLPRSPQTLLLSSTSCLAARPAERCVMQFPAWDSSPAAS